MDMREALADLGRALASKGLPPFLVAANITDATYKSVRLWKEDGCILVESVCTDDETGQDLKFLYRYDPDTVLQRIEMQVGANLQTIWSRKQEISARVSALKSAPVL